jgi:hypothetical protein
MKFEDLYLKGLNRKVNPAVSATDMSEETIKSEIGEYVFTNEIINNLYKILSNIRENQGSSSGIWINGYYGSGKSHFLKYLDYCLSSKWGKTALDRLHDAVAERPPMTLEVEVGELDDLIRWYTDKAKIETIMFNIGTVYNANNGKEDEVFTQVFWNQFNGMRGFNESHLALAENLEKALSDDGKYEAFLQHVSNEGYDWKGNISRFSGSKLDLALELAKDVDDKLSYDVIRNRVKNNDVDVSVKAFAAELKEYIDKKADKNYRMVFLCDEISQFIDNRGGLLLQLQEVVKHCFEKCNSQVWFACTAQQDLSEVIQSSSIQKTSEDYGKIMGRFEVRASLQSTNPEYITQKRILEKKGDVEIQLEDLYKKNKGKLEAQFVLPTTYNAYSDAKDFADYYPFVPYQFRLIQQVLNSFVQMNFVDKQVKGGERSLINITFSIAKETADMEVGEFISFDRFFGAVFQGSMQHLGIRAISNAREALKQVPEEKNPAFYERVINVLFMICNLSPANKQQFAATIDNVVTLLMTKIDESKAAIKSDVSEVLAYLIDKKVIHKVKTEGGTDIYEFYTEEESQVAQIISNMVVDSNTYCEELRKIIFPYFGNMSNKFTYVSRAFSIGAQIDGRTYLANNPDVSIDFLTTATQIVPEQYALSNPDNHLVFFLYPLYKEDSELRSLFLDYCRVQKFLQQEPGSDERQRVMNLFRERASESLKKEIKPKFEKMLDDCAVISGANVLSVAEIGTAKSKERYERAISKHFSLLYNQAKLIGEDYPLTNSDLQKAILRPIDPQLPGLPLPEAEKRIKDVIDRAPHDITVAEVVRTFSRVPYGWSDLATIYYTNELVRRHQYTFAFNNSPVESRKDIAANIVKEASRFTIEPAHAISQQLINDFIASWKSIFNVVEVKGSNDSTELYQECKESEKSPMNILRFNYRKLANDFAGRPFVQVLNDAIALMDKWSEIRDHQKFFETIIADKEMARKLLDGCKNINMFKNDHFENYNKLFDFIDDNKTNFDFLPETHRQTASSLMQIKTDAAPWEHFQSYMKMMRPLQNELKKCRDELVKNVTDAYNKAFAELDAYAEKAKVTPEEYDNHSATLSRMTTSHNFYALKDAADTTGFIAKMINTINEIAASRGAGEPKIRVVRLQTGTGTSHPLRNQEDIDNYLAGLRNQLMQLLGDNDGIIVS